MVRVLGVLVAANSNGIVISSVINPENINIPKESDIRTAHVKSQFFAFGNLVLSNDKAAFVSPVIDKQTRKIIEETLDVEIISRKIAGSDLVGSLAVSTNHGVLISPLASDDEIEGIKQDLQVEIGNIGTINLGQPFVSAGILANSMGCIVGEDTTGLESIRITNTLLIE